MREILAAARVIRQHAFGLIARPSTAQSRRHVMTAHPVVLDNWGLSLTRRPHRISRSGP
jgi:hypothetical protein